MCTKIKQTLEYFLRISTQTLNSYYTKNALIILFERKFYYAFHVLIC